VNRSPYWAGRGSTFRSLKSLLAHIHGPKLSFGLTWVRRNLSHHDAHQTKDAKNEGREYGDSAGQDVCQVKQVEDQPENEETYATEHGGPFG
jgi:hypothetical protein